MAKSINTKVDLTVDGTWFRGIASYGKIMIGDKAFEFYNERNVEDYVQIPWEEVTYVVADVHFHGRYIPRFEIRTKFNGKFILLLVIPRKYYVQLENMYRLIICESIEYMATN